MRTCRSVNTYCTYLLGNYDLFRWFSLSFSSLRVFHVLHFIQTGLLWWFYKKVWKLDYSAKAVMIKRLHSNRYGKLGLIYILKWSEKCLIKKASYHKLTHTLFDIILQGSIKILLMADLKIIEFQALHILSKYLSVDTLTSIYPISYKSRACLNVYF